MKFKVEYFKLNKNCKKKLLTNNELVQATQTQLTKAREQLCTWIVTYEMLIYSFSSSSKIYNINDADFTPPTFSFLIYLKRCIALSAKKSLNLHY